MKKKVLAAVLMGAMVFSMAACGSGDSGSSSDSTTTEDSASSDSSSDSSSSDASAPSGTISVLSREEDQAEQFPYFPVRKVPVQE